MTAERSLPRTMLDAINMDSNIDAEYWAVLLGVSVDEIRQAILFVGSSVYAVSRYLLVSRKGTSTCLH